MHRNVVEFRELVLPLLRAAPVRNTVALSAITMPADSMLMITVHGDQDEPVGAVLRTPPHPLIVSAMPPEMAKITAQAVHDVAPSLDGVFGPTGSAEAFASAWTGITGAAVRQKVAERLFELDKAEFRAPRVAGRARLGTDDDFPLIVRWWQRFAIDIGAGYDPTAEAERRVTDGSANLLWEVDGRPVSYANARKPDAGTSRIAPVYTPDEHRGHGYASAVTAAASRWSLDQGAEHVLLFTDLANPVTNRIYPRIGYRPVMDAVQLAFVSS